MTAWDGITDPRGRSTGGDLRPDDQEHQDAQSSGSWVSSHHPWNRPPAGVPSGEVSRKSGGLLISEGKNVTSVCSPLGRVGLRPWS